MPTNPSSGERNGRHIADQGVTVPTKASIPVCTVDDVFNRRFNDGPQRRHRSQRPHREANGLVADQIEPGARRAPTFSTTSVSGPALHH